MKDTFVFTPDNLLANIDKLGPWSQYGLAEEAIYYYFPHVKRIRDTARQLNEEVRITSVMGFDSWQDWIIKYHKEVGYKSGPDGFHTGAVNEF